MGWTLCNFHRDSPSRRWISIEGLGKLNFKIGPLDREVQISFDNFLIIISKGFKIVKVKSKINSDLDDDRAFEEYLKLIDKM